MLYYSTLCVAVFDLDVKNTCRLSLCICTDVETHSVVCHHVSVLVSKHTACCVLHCFILKLGENM